MSAWALIVHLNLIQPECLGSKCGFCFVGGLTEYCTYGNIACFIPLLGSRWFWAFKWFWISELSERNLWMEKLWDVFDLIRTYQMIYSQNGFTGHWTKIILFFEITLSKCRVSLTVMLNTSRAISYCLPVCDLLHKCNWVTWADRNCRSIAYTRHM